MTAQQLKNSIFQMAVQGKLVPQDPNDEPASVLLERIKAEKEELIKSGKIKKSKKSSEIFRGASRNLPYTFCEQIGKEIKDISDEIPFEIPESWEWVRLGQICEIYRGGSPRPIKDYLTESDNGVNWIKISDSDKGGKYINSTKEKIKPEGMTKSRFVHAGDFLLTNSMSFGRPYILNVDGCIHDGWLVLSKYQIAFDKDFLFYMLSSKFAYYQFCGVVSGAVVKNLNSDKVAKAIFPLPPLAEQRRIVEKIEQLLPFIEKYEQAETQLTTLNTSFPEALKKSILQEAVQGKLVPQNPDDEPASVLLERIRAEKQALIKAGKIKRDKHESVIVTRDKIPYELVDGKERCIADEVPFEIPESWEWAYIGNIAFVTKLAGFEYTKNIAPNLQSSGIPLFKGKNVQNGRLVYNFEGYIPEPLSNELIRSQINKKCLLTPYVGSIGNIAIFPGDFKAHLGSNVGKIEIIQNLVIEEYVMYFFRSYAGYNELTKYKKATAQESISIEAIRNAFIPIPPLAEQKRIVEKIEELIPMINSMSK